MIVDFGNNLKKLRKQAGMTQQQLAERLGVTKSIVSYYELSERTPSPEVLVKLASVFRTSTDALLGITKDAGQEYIDISELSERQKQLLRLFLSILTSEQEH